MIGMCSARVTVGGRQTNALFTVLERCSHDLILGLGFLSEHGALIDCSTGVLRLEMPISPALDDEPDKRLSSKQHICLAPREQLTFPCRVAPKFWTVTT